MKNQRFRNYKDAVRGRAAFQGSRFHFIGMDDHSGCAGKYELFSQTK